MNTIKPGGVEGPRQPEPNRADRTQAARKQVASEARASERSRESQAASRSQDRVELSPHSVQFESRAKELVQHLERSDDNRRAKVERAKKLVASGEIDSKEQYERAAEALLVEARRERRGA